MRDGLRFAGVAVGLAVAGLGVAAAAGPGIAVAPGKMARVGTVDERFQSFNVEMLEVTGGRFWAPYKTAATPAAPAPAAAAPAKAGDTPAGMDPSLYRYREPIDLSNPRLRKLAVALGPMYMRVSGTWANTTYLEDADGPSPKTPAPGFGGVLTRQQWKGVIDFSKAVDAKIVTSFAISPGVRDSEGVWSPVEAKKVLAYTKELGGSIAAAEMFNEPNFASMGGAPKGFDAAQYGKDFKAFREYVKEAAPEIVVLGPGSTGEGTRLGGGPGGTKTIKSEEMLAAAGPGLDAFSYHYYGGASQRCTGANGPGHITPEVALSEAWLSKTNIEEAYYAGLRDRFEPGKPMWLTETAETACGGDPWAATFLDSFRYVNQMGTLAKRGVQVVMHNTLAASDYAVIDEATLEPRPSYWAAVLWRRLMGATVLDAGVPAGNDLYVYAHCLRGTPGGVAMVVIQASKSQPQTLNLAVKSERYTLSAKRLLSATVELNGAELKLGADDSLPKMGGAGTGSGSVTFAPETITFLAMPGAGNEACR